MPRTAESGAVMPFIKAKGKACCDMMTVTCNFFLSVKKKYSRTFYIAASAKR